jgi:hypothetical protein
VCAVPLFEHTSVRPRRFASALPPAHRAYRPPRVSRDVLSPVFKHHRYVGNHGGSGAGCRSADSALPGAHAIKAIEPPPSAPPHTQALRRRTEGGAADAPLLAWSPTADIHHGSAVAGRGYFEILRSLCPPNRQMACLSSS